MLEPSLMHLGTMAAVPDEWKLFVSMYLTAEWQVDMICR
jgi:hypothetical protein